MSEYFEATYKFSGIDDDGKNKTFTDVVLFNTVNFTETEAKVIERCEGESYLINKIQRASFQDIHLKTIEDESYYKAVVVIGADSGKPMKDSYLIAAESPTDVEHFIGDLFSETTFDWDVIEIKKTNISEVVLIRDKEPDNDNLFSGE